MEHHSAGRFDQAGQFYHQVLRADPRHPDALHGLGVMAHQVGKHADAVQLIGQAISAHPQNPHYHNNIALAFMSLGNSTEAIRFLNQALRLKPDYAEVHNNMGLVFFRQGHVKKSIECFKQALKFKHDYADARNNLGNAFLEQSRPAEAIENYKRVLNIRPGNPEAWNNLGNALALQGHYEKAIQRYHQALAFSPEYAKAYNNLGNALQCTGRLGEAVSLYDRALEISPEYAEAHLNRGICCLLGGHFFEGWKGYEWRLRKPEWKLSYPYSVPKWDGSSFAGKRLFVQDEQGMGDSIQFSRYLPMVKARGGMVIFQTVKHLTRLFQGFPGIDKLVERSPRAMPDMAFDLYIPLLSLPGIFNTALDTIPSPIPYVGPALERAGYWKNKIEESRLKVGVVWAGNPAHENDKKRNRTVKLKQILSLCRINGVRLYGMQKGEAAKESQVLGKQPGFSNLGEALKDFADTAGLIKNLDLVISVDTASAHLAGTMGKPVWVLLPHNPDWRWMLDRTDSPWYPTMRLFRQEKTGNWKNILDTMAFELEKLINRE